MIIREAKVTDKRSVLEFCKNTFSWGDYIEYVWDSWQNEGNLFVAIKDKPIGICHSLMTKNQIWIEGIRIHPNHRRKKIASKLVYYLELIAKKQNLQNSFMLIDTQNTSSISLAESLGYSILEKWHFYSLEKNRNTNFNVSFGNCIPTRVKRYVRSWRWLPLDTNIITTMNKNNQIVYSNRQGLSFALLTESEHFAGILIATLFSNSNSDTKEVLSYIQDLGMRKTSKIQILSRETLPNFSGLQKKNSFYLMKKSLG